MGNDETVIWRRRGRLSLPPLPIGNLDGIQLAMRVQKECETLLKLNQGGIELISIERDGPGGSCADQLKYSEYAPILRALHTGARLSDGRHYNIRAYLHAQAKEYLEENETHLPHDPTFFSQITALLHEYKGGLLLIESKEDYKRRLSGAVKKHERQAGRSPDRSDAFILTFAPPPQHPPITRNATTPLLTSSKPWRPLDSTLGY
jgi:hypothetical protein